MYNSAHPDLFKSLSEDEFGSMINELRSDRTNAVDRGIEATEGHGVTPEQYAQGFWKFDNSGKKEK